MTREEIKSLTLISNIDKMFLSRMSIEDRYLIFRYPILIENKEKDRYEINEIIFQIPKLKELFAEQSRWERYIDNLFNKYNIVEVFTDLDYTMDDFGERDKIPSLQKLNEKYPDKNIVINGYHGFYLGEPDPTPLEDIVP